MPDPGSLIPDPAVLRIGTSLFQTRTILEVVARDADNVDPSRDSRAAHVPFENMSAFRTSHAERRS
jgi:hypothetical protein